MYSPRLVLPYHCWPGRKYFPGGHVYPNFSCGGFGCSPGLAARIGWYEDEDFWREMYPYMFPAEKFSAAEEQVSQILSLTALEEGSVLDLCCGPGRHALEFARRGYRVTGVDGRKFLLDRAKERAAETGQQVEWIHQDMREFAKPNAFQLAVNLWSSFGYFENVSLRFGVTVILLSQHGILSGLPRLRSCTRLALV
jgi:SAM-dependent methyltransferase